MGRRMRGSERRDIPNTMAAFLSSQSTQPAIHHHSAHDFPGGAAIGARGLYIKPLSPLVIKLFIAAEEGFHSWKSI